MNCKYTEHILLVYSDVKEMPQTKFYENILEKHILRSMYIYVYFMSMYIYVYIEYILRT